MAGKGRTWPIPLHFLEGITQTELAKTHAQIGESGGTRKEAQTVADGCARPTDTASQLHLLLFAANFTTARRRLSASTWCQNLAWPTLRLNSLSSVFIESHAFLFIRRSPTRDHVYSLYDAITIIMIMIISLDYSPKFCTLLEIELLVISLWLVVIALDTFEYFFMVTSSTSLDSSLLILLDVLSTVGLFSGSCLPTIINNKHLLSQPNCVTN
jgi:hypothetical protein